MADQGERLDDIDDVRDADDDDDLYQALQDPDLVHLYMNNFAIVASHGDVCVVTQQNGATTATLNMSFTLAKTLSLALGQIITRLEADTGQRIMTTDHIRRKAAEAKSAV